jgi:hypothetical protein
VLEEHGRYEVHEKVDARFGQKGTVKPHYHTRIYMHSHVAYKNYINKDIVYKFCVVSLHSAVYLLYHIHKEPSVGIYRAEFYLGQLLSAPKVT